MRDMIRIYHYTQFKELKFSLSLSGFLFSELSHCMCNVFLVSTT